MTTIPSLEHLLLELAQSLGVELGTIGLGSTREKDRFAKSRVSIKTSTKKLEQLVDEIISLLGIDRSDLSDVFLKAENWAQCLHILKKRVWTGNASNRTVLWYLCTLLAPGLGRELAFWNLDERIDPGMPGGQFWFLPSLHPGTGKLRLPLQQVVDWLLDLLGESVVAAGVGAAVFGGRDEVIRNLHNWRNTAAVPRSQSIEEYFCEGAKFEFRGAFDVATNAPFESAQAFVARRGLDANSLRREIPITQHGILEAILARTSDREAEDRFVALLEQRYRAPSLAVIRQRLRVARLAQDAYVRLLTALNPEVDPFCADPTENKILQVRHLLSLSYNLTVEASRGGGSIEDQNAAFEAAIPPWLKHGPFQLILPSLGNDAAEMVAKRLSRIFMRSAEPDEMPDFLLAVETRDRLIAERMVTEMREELAVCTAVHKLLDRARTHSPWRTFQAENRYWVMIEVVGGVGPTRHGGLAAIQRLRTLAQTPFEVLRAVAFELHALLEGDRTKGDATELRVVDLLIEARANPAIGMFEALILIYDAKHHLSINKFAEAQSLFRKALEAATRRGYGMLRGEIARDLFSTEAAEGPVNEHNHASLIRDMVEFDAIETAVFAYPRVEDVAAELRRCFWTKLYRPYPGYPRKQPRYS